MSTPNITPEMIHAARLRQGLTQEDLAGALGISGRTVCKWELGRSEPRGAHLVLLRQWLEGRLVVPSSGRRCW